MSIKIHKRSFSQASSSNKKFQIDFQVEGTQAIIVAPVCRGASNSFVGFMSGANVKCNSFLVHQQWQLQLTTS